MKSKLILFVIALTHCYATAQTLNVSAQDSHVTFKIKNFGATVDGAFKDLQGTVQFDPTSLATAQFNVSINVNSINTDINMRDNHLRKEEYFDAGRYPQIKFVSTKVESTQKPGTYRLTGKLTIKKTTREISFPFLYSTTANQFIFKAQVEINRRDYEIGGSSMSMSDNATVVLQLVAKN